MKKLMLVIFLAALLGATNTYAQQDDFGWRIGYGVGFMDYYGDLSYKISHTAKDHYIKTKDRGALAQGIFIERRLAPGTSLQLNYNFGKFSASDKAYKGSDYYLRGLNFETSVKDVSAAFVFRSDNGYLLGRNAFIAPYVLVGAGITRFEVFGDLKDENGAYYDYSDNNEEVELDGDYETELTNIGTELEDDYKTTVLNIPVGFGVKFGLGPRVSLHLQTDLKYTFTDHLDDVSDVDYRVAYDSDLQEYAARPNPAYNESIRGNDNGLNDIYMFTSASLRFSFGRKNEKFKTPFIYTNDSPALYNSEANKQTDINNSEDASSENESKANSSSAKTSAENEVEAIAKENASSNDDNNQAEASPVQAEKENEGIAIEQADEKSSENENVNDSNELNTPSNITEGANPEGGIDSDSKINITINNNIYKDGEIEVEETKEIIKVIEIEEEEEDQSEKKNEAKEKEKIEKDKAIKEEKAKEEKAKEEERSAEVEELKKEMEELQRKLELKEVLEEEKEKQKLNEDIEDIKEEIKELNDKSTSTKKAEDAAQKEENKEAKRQAKELEKELEAMQKQMDELNEELKKKESRPINNQKTSDNNASKSNTSEDENVVEEVEMQKEAKFELKEPINAGGTKSSSKLNLVEQKRLQVNFSLNSDKLAQTSELDKLKQLATQMAGDSSLWLHIKGYTDKNTSDKKLAEKRANYIKDYLVKTLNVNPQKLILSSFEQNDFFILDVDGNELDQKAIIVLLK